MANVRVYGKGGGSGSSGGSPLLAGILIAFVVIIAWVILVYITHHSVGVAAWGVGGLLGLVFAKVAKPPTKATAIQAAILTFVTVLAAKVAVVVFALQPIIRDEIARDQDTIAALYLVEMTKNHAFSPDLQREIDARPSLVRDTTEFGPGYELQYRMVSEAATRAQAAERPERERLIRVHLDTFISKLGFWVLLLATFGLLDLLWIGLGVSTAWKLGQGIG
jgi:hypothetical protein